MKGNSPLFNQTAKNGALRDSNGPKTAKFTIDLQLFAEKRVSDYGIELQKETSNQKLKNTIGELYREGATVGDGGLADAVKYQLKTGRLVGGKDHLQKAHERIVNLERIIQKESLNSHDRMLAIHLLNGIKNALEGK